VKSGKFRDVFVEVGFLSGRVLRCRLSVGTCSTMSGECQYVFGEVDTLTGLVRLGRLIVGNCSTKSD